MSEEGLWTDFDVAVEREVKERREGMGFGENG